MPEIRTHTGTAARPFLADLARLRISVFRSFPYLYEGSLEDETGYLADYFSSEKSLLVTVEENSVIVGASTAGPLVEAGLGFQTPFLEKSMALDEIFYFGESILMPEYRGQGIGHRFFDLRESWAKFCGFRIAAFCAVEREPDHPQRPADYRPLDSFWKSRGYAKREDLVAKLFWKEVGGEARPEVGHDLTFWLKSL